MEDWGLELMKHILTIVVVEKKEVMVVDVMHHLMEAEENIGEIKQGWFQ